MGTGSDPGLESGKFLSGSNFIIFCILLGLDFVSREGPGNDYGKRKGLSYFLNISFGK